MFKSDFLDDGEEIYAILQDLHEESACGHHYDRAHQMGKLKDRQVEDQNRFLQERLKHESPACNHGVGCTHNHQSFGDSQTENPATQYPAVRLQHPVVSASQPIYQSKPGDRLKLHFGNELVLDARVKVNKTFPVGSSRSPCSCWGVRALFIG